MLTQSPLAIRGDGRLWCIEYGCALRTYSQRVHDILWPTEDPLPHDDNGTPLGILYASDQLDALRCAGCRQPFAAMSERKVAEALETAHTATIMARSATIAVREWIDALKERRVEARRACKSDDRRTGVRSMSMWLNNILGASTDLTGRAVTLADKERLYTRYHEQYVTLREQAKPDLPARPTAPVEHAGSTSSPSPSRYSWVVPDAVLTTMSNWSVSPVAYTVSGTSATGSTVPAAPTNPLRDDRAAREQRYQEEMNLWEDQFDRWLTSHNDDD